MWSKKFSSYCGENLGGVKRHLWLGADTAGGGGGVRGGGKISSLPANCPDQKLPGIVPGFLDPLSFCRRGAAADYQSGGRATGRFLRLQPLSQMSRALNHSESVLCQMENDEKKCKVGKRPN